MYRECRRLVAVFFPASMYLGISRLHDIPASTYMGISRARSFPPQVKAGIPGLQILASNTSILLALGWEG
jgi:hypothetical protein